MKIRLTALIIASFLLFLIGFVGYTFSTTGFFRDIENASRLKVLRSVDIPGAEDITISRDGSFAIISSDDRAARRDGRYYQGGLYYMDLTDLATDPRLISGHIERTLNPHGIHLLPIDSNRYQLLVVNHLAGTHSIERLLLLSDSLVHIETLTDAAMNSPNDVVAIDTEHFFFTNDHGFTSPLGIFMENYLGLAVSNVVYYNGSTYEEAAKGIAYANGINFNPRLKQLYVAAPRDFKVMVYDWKEGGTLRLNRSVYVGMGTDNLEIDEDGAVWTGGHPNLLRWSSYAAGKAKTAPSEVVRIRLGEQGDTVDQWFLDDGKLISGASVAARRGNLVLIGNVMDKQFLIAEMQ